MSADCLFCQIVDRQIPAQVVYDDDQALAFADINPQAPVHLLVIPKRHIPGSHTLEASDNALVGHLFQVMRHLADEQGVSAGGYRVVTNNGADAGQSVPHLHFHLLGGRPLDWPPG